ncbi:hypothetical protein F5B22DRAFT_30292 [Xylaria bambusicola]|uniref:uncharacterized protein n=1 Tax=Xylaria bambusicola TaxID=326684 RepID=UPI002008BDE4|nr:uncharacterized protein F5B22DRAFT_30292 [Xylaria bambusicola]KAI0528295.1 hypothetical protein F5B22DRAFT_30292 [Xylaria bambusicola]
MPAVKQQRKAAPGSKGKTIQQHASSGISSFARVSKTSGNASIKKELTPSTPRKDVKLEAITPASRKRKVIVSIEDESSADESPKNVITSSTRKIASSSTATTPVQPVKRGRGRPPKKARPEPTPRKRVRSPSVSDSDASTVDTGVLFKKLRLESSPSRFSSPVTADTSVAGSDIESDTNPAKSSKLPEEVISLIDLHTAFLKTLSLHYAHNGSNVPADLRILCPNIARAWGKKKVTDADIRVCLGILGSSSSSLSSSPFTLSNYGRGKICIEINQSRNFGPLSEDKLNTLFRTNITALWTTFLANGNENSASAFLPTLPKAPVTLCESLAKASPLLLKGQQRLEDLKHGIAAKKQEKIAPKPSPADTTMRNVDGTKMSLLDRIRLKSLQKSAMPAGLSPAQLERRGALQRVEEVSALIGMLSRASSEGGMGGRISFTMAALLEKLKDSFRMGISKPEGAACVRLLASEVAPEWIRVVTLAGRENVVVEVSCQLGKPEVARRVQDILGRE